MAMEPKYYAFRRWLDTPIMLWQYDWMPRVIHYTSLYTDPINFVQSSSWRKIQVFHQPAFQCESGPGTWTTGAKNLHRQRRKEVEKKELLWIQPWEITMKKTPFERIWFYFFLNLRLILVETNLMCIKFEVLMGVPFNFVWRLVV